MVLEVSGGRMAKVSVVLCSFQFPEEKFFSSLEKNRSYVGEVVVPFEGLNSDSDFNIRSFGRELKGRKLTRAEVRNFLVSKASNEDVLFLSESTYLEEDFIGELLEEKKEFSADIVFGNPIYFFNGKEDVKNLEQLFEKEKTLVSSLSIEDYVPEWGVLTTKSVIERGRGFDSFLEDYEFYDFIYRNIGWLRLRLAEFSYFTQEIKDSFVDTAWRSFVLRRMLGKFDWKKEVFPYLSWDEKPEVAKATALTLVGNQLCKYFDFFNASNCYREALLSFHNQETLRRLIDSLKGMGLFDRVRELLSPEQGIPEDDVERELQFLEGVETVISDLERAVEEGKALEALSAAVELAGVYEGAPLYNLFGVINWLRKDFESAYRFFYKAVTMNPINRDFLYNLFSVAETLDRKDKVEKLLMILVGEGNIEERV